MQRRYWLRVRCVSRQIACVILVGDDDGIDPVHHPLHGISCSAAIIVPVIFYDILR